jgi:hypothetical protein
MTQGPKVVISLIFTPSQAYLLYLFRDTIPLSTINDRQYAFDFFRFHYLNVGRVNYRMPPIHVLPMSNSQWLSYILTNGFFPQHSRYLP